MKHFSLKDFSDFLPISKSRGQLSLDSSPMPKMRTVGCTSTANRNCCSRSPDRQRALRRRCLFLPCGHLLICGPRLRRDRWLCQPPQRLHSFVTVTAWWAAQRRLKCASVPHFRPGDCSLQQRTEGNSEGRKELTREEERGRGQIRMRRERPHPVTHGASLDPGGRSRLLTE